MLWCICSWHRKLLTATPRHKVQRLPAALTQLLPPRAGNRRRRAGICSTDLEITRGYVPGYCHVMGHEFVGVVARCSAKPSLVGTRVVGEINCNCAKFTCADAMFQRNHAPGRTVLGIIGKDGAMAQVGIME